MILLPSNFQVFVMVMNYFAQKITSCSLDPFGRGHGGSLLKELPTRERLNESHADNEKQIFAEERHSGSLNCQEHATLDVL